MPEYETPSLFEQSPDGASNSEAPRPQSIAERTGYNPNAGDSDHGRTPPDVHTDVTGRIPEAHVETSPEGRRTMELLERRRQGGDPAGQSKVDELRQQIASMPDPDPRPPIPPLDADFDPTVFDQVVPEGRPVPNQPSQPARRPHTEPREVYPDFKQPPAPKSEERPVDPDQHDALSDSRRYLSGESPEDF